MGKHLIINTNKVNHFHINHKIRKTGKYAKYEKIAKVYFNNMDRDTYNEQDEFMIYKLAMHYLSNNATTNINKLSNLRKCFTLLKKLSVKGNLVAKYRLAQLYLNGNDVVVKDVKKAIRLLEMIIGHDPENVSLYAMYDLAKIYLNGDGVQRNFSKAVDLLSDIMENHNYLLNNDHNDYEEEFPIDEILEKGPKIFLNDETECTNDEINYLFKYMFNIYNFYGNESTFIDYPELVGYANRHNLLLNLNDIFIKYKCNWGIAKQELTNYSNFQEFTNNVDQYCPITMTPISDNSEVIIFHRNKKINGVFNYDALMDYWSRDREKIGLNPYAQSDNNQQLFMISDNEKDLPGLSYMQNIMLR